MTTKLFQTLVVSSALLLSTGCGVVVRAGDDGGPDAAERDASDATMATADRPSPPEPPEPPAPPAPDAAVVVDASERDARQSEAGWPTTKGAFCEQPDGGDAFCCRIPRAGEMPTSLGLLCCLGDPPDEANCRRCVVDPERRVCDPNADAGTP